MKTRKLDGGFSKTGLSILIVVLVAGIGAGLVAKRYSRTSPRVDRIPATARLPQMKATLRLRWLAQSQFAGVYWAARKGLFEKEGIEVAVNPAGPGINFIQLVGSGAEDFGICAAPQIIEARAKGLPVVALAVIFQANPIIFFAKKDSGIKEPADWIGKTVAVFNGFEQENVFRALLKKTGVDPKKLHEYPAKFDMTPFFRDEVQVWSGYVINQPNTAEERGFPVTRMFPDDYGVHISGDTLYTTEKVIREKPELVQRMVNAILAGWRQALANKSEAVDIILSIDSKLDRVHETKMIDSVEKLTLTKDIDGKIGWMTEEQWRGMAGLWKQFGGISTDINPSDCYNRTFLDKHYSKPQ